MRRTEQKAKARPAGSRRLATGLDAYRGKRDFRTTPEPRGRKGRRKAAPLSFVVQKHAASHLHYDFRLELNGVLLSWAVPKGPSLDPAAKRLAIHVEDHPVEYGDFEGVIPDKQYGSGTVMVWDRGSWIPHGDPAAGYAQGKLEFELIGSKLKGAWALVRSRSARFGGKAGDKAWLLIKEKDEFAKPDGDGIEHAADSAVSGRTMEEIALDQDRVWRSDRSVAANVRAKDAGNTIAGITLSHSSKLLYPDAKLSKLDLARYYEAVGDWIVPHLEHRPLSLVRCPDGWTGQCFFQKHADRSVAAAVARVEVPEAKGTAIYLMANSIPALVALVQWGVLEVHPWGSRAPKLRRPDRLIFDFDPDPSVDWKSLVEAVGLLRTLLTDIGLTGFLKTTGGKGLHVVVPIRPTLDWDQARAFTRAVAELMVQTFPDRFVATVSKSRRRGKILIDYLRNAQGATAVCAYSPRARAHAPVATPIDWEDLGEDVRFHHFNVRNIPSRLNALRRDPWQSFPSVKQSVTKAILARFGVAA